MYRAIQSLLSPVYQVGGSVRDELLGITPNDYDFSTPHPPEIIEAVIRAAGMYPSLKGKQYGTIGCILQGMRIEITTFRCDYYNSVDRKPIVTFTSEILTDLARRDFTVNAMARNSNELIDPYNGQIDIRLQKLRAVGNPMERFTEDPLRMLRLIRLAAQLKFTIDESTLAAAHALSRNIVRVSPERWSEEMDKLLLTNHPSIGLRFLKQSNLIFYMFPELAAQIDFNQSKNNLWEQKLNLVDEVEVKLDQRWVAFFSLLDLSVSGSRANSVNFSVQASRQIAVQTGLRLNWSRARKMKIDALISSNRL